MKKIITLLSILIGFMASSYAQSLKIIYNGQETDDTLYINTTEYTPEEEVIVYLRFLSEAGGDSVTFSQNTIDLPVGAIIQWCGPGGFGECKMDDGTSDGFKITGEASDETLFKIDAFVNENHDPIRVLYTLKSIPNPEIEASVVIVFKDESNVKINTTQKVDVKLDVYPNPVASNLNIRCAFPKPQKEAFWVLKNMLGTTVKEISIPSELQGKSFNVNVENLPEGLYFYSLVLNGKIHTTKKLVIKH